MCDPTTFVSSIKVKGIHLLPPVITPKRRTELEKDRAQAIKLEKRLENTRKLKSDLEELLTLNNLSEQQLTAFSNSHSKKTNLSKEIVDISEYRNDIKIFPSDFSTISGSSKSHANSNSQQDVDDSSIKTNASSIISCDVNDINSASSSASKLDMCPALNLSKLSSTSGSKTPSPRKSPKPRMIRSNSYTLDAPSPILLAHLENCSKTAIHDAAESVDTSLHRVWGSLDNNYVPFEQSQFSSLNTVYNFNENNSEESKAAANTIKNDVASPTIEVVQTDISVQQITVNANTEEIQPVKTTLELTDPDCQLMQVLKKIPEEYSKQIIELIEKQKSDHSLKVDKFSKQFCSTPKSADDTRPVTASPSQSLYYSFSSSDTIVPTSPFSKTPYSDYYDDKGSFKGEDKYQNVVKKIKNQSESRGKMFYTNKNVDSIKEEWAASVVCAHVKGYLTRRLLKTETVQSVIDTIKHALQCALELHNIEDIDESDIELHRRLINQVSAACYEFHDIFFSLSTKEQMNIIAADRKRITEKNRRAKSGSNIRRSISNSSRSSIRSLNSLKSTKSN